MPHPLTAITDDELLRHLDDSLLKQIRQARQEIRAIHNHSYPLAVADELHLRHRKAYRQIKKAERALSTYLLTKPTT